MLVKGRTAMWLEVGNDFKVSVIVMDFDDSEFYFEFGETISNDCTHIG